MASSFLTQGATTNPLLTPSTRPNSNPLTLAVPKSTVNPLTYNPSTKPTPSPLTGTGALSNALSYISGLQPSGQSKLPVTVAAPKPVAKVAPKVTTTPVKAVSAPVATPQIKANTTTSTPTTAGLIPQPTAQPIAPAAPVNPYATYGSTAQELAQMSGGENEDFNRLSDEAKQAYINAANFGRQVGEKIMDVKTNPEYSIDTGVGLGNRIAQNTGLQMQELNNTAAGLSTLAGQQTSQQGVRQTGLGNAAGLMAPIQVPYSTQLLNPTNGESIGGAAGGNIQQAAQSIAQRVASGQMSYDAGVSALAGYGAMAPQALLAALPSGFNVQESNANAAAQAASIQQTGTLGGQITKAADSANQALSKLEQDFQKLSSLQTGGIPATNNIANWIAAQFGQEALSAYTTTLHDARAQIQGVLSTAGGMTPTGAGEAAQTYLPDNMTPAQFASKVAAARELVRQKVSAFTSTNNSSSAGSTGGTSWDDL